MNTFENSFTIFITALEFIEHNLTDEFTQEDIAAHCCSLSSLSYGAGQFKRCAE